MNIILAGGTGFIGKELISLLIKKGHKVILLSRKPSQRSDNPSITYVQWDGKNSGPWEKSFDAADAVINLCGEPIAGKRWSAVQKKLVLSSRLDTTKAICNAISKSSRKPAVLINASGAGYYGNRSEETLIESAPPGKGFLPETCIAWEKEAIRAESSGVRVVMLRIGMVLEKTGGALEKLLPPFYFFAGGPLGSGKQGMPWIHRDDVLGIIEFALKQSKLSGPLNVVAPEPLTNKLFSHILGKVINRPSWLPAPSWALKLILGEMADELLISGQRPVPAKVLAAGYHFKYPQLETALRSILNGSIPPPE